ncbi:DUF5994 family protein [Mycobacterium sp. B14F4]|uniref:DUF5994 family protein n=1 Tax=Mycobacterium sp. B14F4 TaxID=3153565 RepID=UPI00325E059B
MNGTAQRRSASPIRLALAAASGDDLDGAWWPRTGSIGAELAEFIDALRESLGQIIDIRVNWSSSDAMPDLNMLTRRGVAAIPGYMDRPQRIITMIGSQSRANLLVVPNHTTPVLAMMVLRHAAALPIESRHHETPAYVAAGAIVRTARAQCARRSGVAMAEPPGSPSS